MALIVASVPELTSRTFSTDGTASMISSANSFSASVGAPKLVPRRTAALDRLDHRRMGVPEDHRSPGADVVDVAVAVDVEQIGPLQRGRMKIGSPPDAAKRPGRTVDAAGHQLLGSFKDDMTARVV